ncbi:hypothetical protein [Pusillimonas sp. NJUB218]|uniref:hypothetical protein n=1 Tax=Pusillimonas sp. NJUB218 TaxID=2023230 RepID=UPI000F4D257A|nr:hypothetical protein [Pusillimonas sp. NJUB218]ROT46101.1 hypothetical protein CHR62_03750 [Pusillimonas sp. NJUB218]
MKERPILFSGSMVRAILAGQKTQTRRVAKPIRHPDLGNMYTPGALVLESETRHVIERACPYGQPGDRLWVRETWARPTTLDPGPVIYRADYPACVPSHYENVPPADEVVWKPSIHMPRIASRIELEVTDVRVERLLDINEADCRAEGAHGGHGSIPGYAYNATPLEHYLYIWESINGPGSSRLNPWVWVVEFKKVQS